MRFPDAKLVMPTQTYKVNNKIIYTDKEGTEHTGVVTSAIFKNLIIGYLYTIELDEPYNGNTKFLVKKDKLKMQPKTNE